MRHLAALLALLPAAAATQSAAQSGPSFDCADASTRTELAICASPELAALERATVAAYERLALAIGPREARRLADRQLERRQACEGDAACIAQRLLLSAEVFAQRSEGALGGDEDFARMEDILRLNPGYEDLPDMVAPQAEPLAPPPAAIEPDAAPAAPRPPAAVGDPDAAAPFDTPLSWAWMDLERETRAALQRRLAEAGLLAPGAATTGAWTEATRAALVAFDAEEDGFDAATREGAALMLDFVGSEAFAAAHAGAPAAPAPLAADDGDPLAGTDW